MLPPLPQPWCKIMQQEKVALKFWQAEGVLNYNCVDTGELCAMCCAAPTHFKAWLKHQGGQAAVV